jgi:hypothetical protein
VTSTVLVDGAPAASCRVTFELVTGSGHVPGWRTDKAHLFGTIVTTTNASGVWTVDLEPNSGSGIVTPTGTKWRVTELPDTAPAVFYYLTVPDTAGPHQAKDLLAAAPS